MASAPAPYWEVVYDHSRRKHAHRCMCCSRILKTGERALMTQQRRGAVAIHLACADNEYFPGSTWRDAFECWGGAHNRAVGFDIPYHRLETV